MPARLPASLIVCLCLCVCLCMLGAMPAQAQGQAQGQAQAQTPPHPPAAAAAADNSAADAILQRLQNKGLMAAAAVGAEAQPRLRQMRDAASDMVMSAMQFLGVPYRRGGNDEHSGFDCSGFTRHVFENSIGLVLPRRADEQARDSKLRQVLRDELKPGDLVFFNTMRRAFSHVGIYVGDGKFIHSPSAGGKVRIEDLRQAYWSQRFNGARRPDAGGPTATALPLPLPLPSPSPLPSPLLLTPVPALPATAPATLSATPLAVPVVDSARTP